MDRVLVVIGAVTLVGYLLLALIRPSMAAGGLDTTADMFVQAAPWIIVSLFSAGLLAQFFHPEQVARWLGQDAGPMGVILGGVLGLLGTGSRWAVYPLAAGLIAADATPGSVFAFMTSWQLVSLPRLPAEIPFIGLRLTIVRAFVSLLLAIVGGLVVNALMYRFPPRS